MLDCVKWTIEDDYGGWGDKNYTATTVDDCRTGCINNGSCTVDRLGRRVADRKTVLAGWTLDISEWS